MLTFICLLLLLSVEVGLLGLVNVCTDHTGISLVPVFSSIDSTQCGVVGQPI